MLNVFVVLPQSSEGPLIPRLRSESRDSVISVGMSAGRRRSLRNNNSGQIVRENINQELQASRQASRCVSPIDGFAVPSITIHTQSRGNRLAPIVCLTKAFAAFSIYRSFYLITMFVVTSQVLAACIVLPMYWNTPCDAPLNVWCTVYGM